MPSHTASLLILAVSAFVPPLIFLVWVRGTERYGKEPWGRVLRTFLWGAVFAILLAGLLSVILFVLFQQIDRVYVFSGRFPNLEIIILALVIAPITEELAKGLGVYLARPTIDEPEDGLVYGAASGFGFAASENLLYGVTALALTGQIAASLLLIGVRSISSALLHASATAAFGYGIARKRLWPGYYRIFPYYVLAVAMHASFNLAASLGELYAGVLGDAANMAGLIVAIGIAVLAFIVMRAKIASQDAQRVRW